jgi:hypothetical protein
MFAQCGFEIYCRRTSLLFDGQTTTEVETHCHALHEKKEEEKDESHAREELTSSRFRNASSPERR